MSCAPMLRQQPIRAGISHWTQAENMRLRNLWGVVPLAEIEKKLGRSKTAIVWHARQILGLSTGIPRGCEFLTAAAQRTGFTVLQLRRILRWAGVALRISETARGSKSGNREHFVEPFDVDEAVVAWLATETHASAARRYGVSDWTMTKWLRKAGITDKRGSKLPRSHHRVLSSQVDRMMAERKASEGLTEPVYHAAERHGLKGPILSRWLQEAGIVRGGYHWRVAPEVVDRVVAERRARPSCRAKGRAS